MFSYYLGVCEDNVVKYLAWLQDIWPNFIWNLLRVSSSYTTATYQVFRMKMSAVSWPRHPQQSQHWICRHWGVGEMNCIDLGRGGGCLFSPSWAKPYLSVPVTMTYSCFSLGRLALLSRLSAHWGLAAWYSSGWPDGYKYTGLGFIKCICIYYFWAPQLLDLSKSDQYFGKIQDHTFSVMLMSEKLCESLLRVVLCTVTTFLWSTYETLTVSHSFNWGPDFMDSCFMAEVAVKSLQGLPSLSLNVS